MREACIERGQRWFRLQLGYKHHEYNAIAHEIIDIREEDQEQGQECYVSRPVAWAVPCTK